MDIRTPMQNGFLMDLWQGNVTHRKMLLLLAGIWVILVLTHLTPCAKSDTDTGANLALAKSIADGEGYMLEGKFCRVYPPLFPIALSVAHFLNWPGYVFEKLIVMLAALGAIFCAYFFLMQRYEGRELTVLTLLIAVSPALLEYSFRIRPDVPFMLFVLVFLIGGTIYWRSARIHWPLALVSALALAVATLTRSAGVAFYAASALWLMRIKLWRSDARRCIVFLAFILLVACPPLLGWSSWLKRHKEEGTGSYANMFTRKVPEGNAPFSAKGLYLLAARWSETIPEQIYAGARSTMSSGKGVPATIWTFLVVPVLLLGLIRRMREPELSDYCFCGYSILILLWPSPQGYRFWLPVLPLTWGYIADGLKMFGHLTQEFPRLARWERFRPYDEFLGRFRVNGTRWAVIFLLGLAIVYSSCMVAESWRTCRKAINYLVLGKYTMPLARFLEARQDQNTVLAYWRGFEIRPAIANPRARVVGVRMCAEDNVGSLMRSMSDEGVTHLAIDHRNMDPVAHRGQLLEAAKKRLLADTSGAWLVEDTGRVNIFRVPTSAYWSSKAATEPELVNGNGVIDMKARKSVPAGGSTVVTPW